MPQPPGGQPQIRAHVLIAQNPPHDQAAVLVSVTEMLEDPWHPDRFAVFLPTEVSRARLCQEATVQETIFPYHAQCQAFHGTVELREHDVFPARNGFGFEVVVPALDRDHSDEAVNLIQLQVQGVRHSMARLAKALDAIHSDMVSPLPTIRGDNPATYATTKTHMHSPTLRTTAPTQPVGLVLPAPAPGRPVSRTAFD